MELVQEPADRRRKRMIIAMAVVFTGLLVFFTLFGNTLQTLTLPKVRTVKPVSGELKFTLEGSGSVQPIAEAKLSNPAGWKVQTIHVKEGDRVKKGQTLITYDGDTAERELADEITSLAKQKIELQNVQDQFIQSSMGGDELDIRKSKRNIETLKLDLGTQERKISELRNDLAHNAAITAPFDGMVTQVNAVEGVPSAGAPDVLITNSSMGYRLDVTADASLLENVGVAIGEKLGIEIEAVQEQQRRIIDGTIDEIADAQPRIGSSSGEEAGSFPAIPQKVIRLLVADPGLKGGEQASIHLEKPSRQEGLIVANEAIHQDGDSRFVYKVEEQRGALGNVFVARQVPIQSSSTNGDETIIQSDGLYEDDLIIVESSEPLQDGNRVRLQ